VVGDSSRSARRLLEQRRGQKRPGLHRSGEIHSYDPDEIPEYARNGQLDVVRQRGDVEGLNACLHPDPVDKQHAGQPFAGKYECISAFHELLRRIGAAYRFDKLETLRTFCGVDCDDIAFAAARGERREDPPETQDDGHGALTVSRQESDLHTAPLVRHPAPVLMARSQPPKKSSAGSNPREASLAAGSQAHFQLAPAIGDEPHSASTPSSV
jgi:hypothetical protein